MRNVILLFASLLSSTAGADLLDPRNTAEYHVLFDLGALSKAEVASGYGGYVQIYSGRGKHLFRYCENFEGQGASGRPNPHRVRRKLLPLGGTDPTAYRCRDFTPAEFTAGQPLIKMGDRSLFAMKAARWTEREGGELFFQFAKRLPLLGSPTYRTLRIRAVRAATALDYVVETVVPKTGVLPFHYYRFDVSGSGLGLPNGISGLTLDPGERSESAIDLDVLEGPIKILGHAKEGGKKIGLSG